MRLDLLMWVKAYPRQPYLTTLTWLVVALDVCQGTTRFIQGIQAGAEADLCQLKIPGGTLMITASEHWFLIATEKLLKATNWKHDESEPPKRIPEAGKKKHRPSSVTGWWDVKLSNKFSVDRSCCKSHPAGRVFLSMQFVVPKHPMLHWPLWCWLASWMPDTRIQLATVACLQTADMPQCLHIPQELMNAMSLLILEVTTKNKIGGLACLKSSLVFLERNKMAVENAQHSFCQASFCPSKRVQLRRSVNAP